jgi:DNA-3-methyladenine glycosylase
MFRKAGTIYVYFVYGMHEMLNLVTGKEGYPAAVLIRGVAGFRGPGKLTKALGITRTLNGKTLGTTTGLWVESPTCARIYRILRTPRIGVSYAHEWAGKKLRFIAQESTGGASRTHRP